MTKRSGHFLCFVHIEKAGGMTMHQLFHHTFRGYLSPHPGFGEHMSVDQLKSLMKWWPYRISGIGGHRMGAFLNYESLIKDPIFYVTFLRDPVKRYLSSINWKNHIMGQNWTVESYVAEPYYHNFQCYRIAGEQSFEKARDIILEKFGFVGFMEEFDSSLLLMQNEWPGEKIDVRYVRDNVKNYGDLEIKWDDLSPELQEQYRYCNAEDIKLVEFVRNELWPKYQERFHYNLDEKVAEFQQQLKQYKVSPQLFVKQKGTNFLLGRILQPLLFGPALPAK